MRAGRLRRPPCPAGPQRPGRLARRERQRVGTGMTAAPVSARNPNSEHGARLCVTMLALLLDAAAAARLPQTLMLVRRT